MEPPAGARWGWHDVVRKKRGSSWRGRVVGFYSTEHTPIGYNVESLFEPGSVQCWPEAALEAWTPSLGEAFAVASAAPDLDALARSLGEDLGQRGG